MSESEKSNKKKTNKYQNLYKQGKYMKENKPELEIMHSPKLLMLLFYIRMASFCWTLKVNRKINFFKFNVVDMMLCNRSAADFIKMSERRIDNVTFGSIYTPDDQDREYIDNRVKGDDSLEDKLKTIVDDETETLETELDEMIIIEDLEDQERFVEEKKKKKMSEKFWKKE